MPADPAPTGRGAGELDRDMGFVAIEKLRSAMQDERRGVAEEVAGTQHRLQPTAMLENGLRRGAECTHPVIRAPDIPLRSSPAADSGCGGVDRSKRHPSELGWNRSRSTHPAQCGRPRSTAAGSIHSAQETVRLSTQRAAFTRAKCWLRAMIPPIWHESKGVVLPDEGSTTERARRRRSCRGDRRGVGASPSSGR